MNHVQYIIYKIGTLTVLRPAGDVRYSVKYDEDTSSSTHPNGHNTLVLDLYSSSSSTLCFSLHTPSPSHKTPCGFGRRGCKPNPLQFQHQAAVEDDLVDCVCVCVHEDIAYWWKVKEQIIQRQRIVDDETLTLSEEYNKEHCKHQGSALVPRIHIGLILIRSSYKVNGFRVLKDIYIHTYMHTHTNTRVVVINCCLQHELMIIIVWL